MHPASAVEMIPPAFGYRSEDSMEPEARSAAGGVLEDRLTKLARALA